MRRHDRKERKPEFGRTWAGDHTGGLAEALDLWLSSYIGEEKHREQVARFKAKWLARHTPKDRVEFYQRRFEEHATEVMERFVRELGEVVALPRRGIQRDSQTSARALRRVSVLRRVACDNY